VYVDKLLLSAACVNALGNPRDELIVKEVSAVMEKTRQRKRWAKDRLCRVRQLDEVASASHSVSVDLDAAAGYDEDDVVDLLRPMDMASAAGVTNRTMIRRLKAESKQAELPASVDKLMEQLQGQLQTKGVLDPLPLSASVDRKRQTAMETVRLREWLQSEEGKEWKNQRAETWSTASWSLPAASATAAASSSAKSDATAASSGFNTAQAPCAGLSAWFSYSSVIESKSRTNYTAQQEKNLHLRCCFDD
ncbi:unnamed protein product, partial [Symbiodinium sp. CCMP2456]